MNRRLLLSLLLLSPACSDYRPPAPGELDMTPKQGRDSEDTPLTVSGDFEVATLRVNYSDSNATEVQGKVTIWLGELQLPDATVVEKGRVLTFVPRGSPPGAHEVRVLDARGVEGIVPDPFCLLAAVEQIARFEVELPADAQVGDSVPLRIRALNESDEIVDNFAGEVEGIGLGAGVSIGPFDAGVFDGEILATTAGTLRLMVSVSGATECSEYSAMGESGTVVVEPSEATTIAFLNAPRSPAAGACSDALVLGTQDDFGNDQTVTAPVSIDVSSDSSAMSFYLDSDCTRPAGTLTIQAGEQRTGFHLLGEEAGAFTVEARTLRLGDAKQAVSIGAGRPERLAFVNDPRTARAGECSEALRIESQDEFGNAVPVSTTVGVRFDASPDAGFGFYADAGCTVGLNRTDIPAGGRDIEVYFKGEIAGATHVLATAAGLADASQIEYVVAASPVRLVFVTPERTLVAGGCSEVVTVEQRDAFGNPAPAEANRTLAPTASNPGVSFYEDECQDNPVTSVTIPVGATSASFHLKAERAGWDEIKVSSDLGGTISQPFLTVAGEPKSFAFISAPQTVQSNLCSAEARVELRDDFGNRAVAISPVAPQFQAIPGDGILLFTDACQTQGDTKLIAVGGSEASIWFRANGTRPEYDLEVSAPGLQPAVQPQVVTVGAPGSLQFVTGSHAVSANQCSPAVTVEAVDSQGAAVTVPSDLTVSALVSPTNGVALFSDATCSAPLINGTTILAGQSSATIYYRGTLAGSVTLSLSAAGFASAIQSHMIYPGAATRLAFTTPARSVTAGECSQKVTVQAQDDWGNPAAPSADVYVNLAASPGAGFGFYSSANCSAGTSILELLLGQGNAGASFYVKGTAARVVDVTASAANNLQAASQPVTVLPAMASRLAFSSQSQQVTAGECSGDVVLEIQDSFGNPTAPSSAFTVDLTSDATVYSDDCQTATTQVQVGAGQPSIWLHFSSTVAGPVDISAAVSNWGSAPAVQTELVRADVPTKIEFTTAPRSISTAGCSAAVTLVRRDQYGNPSDVSTPTNISLGSSPLGLVFSGPACPGPVFTGVSIPAGATTTSFSFSGTAPGMYTIDANAAFGQATQAATVVGVLPSVCVALLCPGQCQADVCVVDCATNNCAAVDCPAGHTCQLDCQTPGSCPSSVSCSGLGACEIECGASACGSDVSCSAAAGCSIDCSALDSCGGNVTCGPGACEIDCAPGACGSVDCLSSCACDVSCVGCSASCPAGCSSLNGCDSSEPMCMPSC